MSVNPVESTLSYKTSDALRRTFVDKFGDSPRVFRAPGRVNIIGEHTDYNDGFVLPMPIDRYTTVAGSAREDRHVRVYSIDIGEQLEFDLDVSAEPRPESWLSYIEGVARVLEDRGARLKGADLLINTDIPIGSGLSSSAALEVSAGYSLLRLSGLVPDLIELAKAGQKAEHEYVGAKVGIMDQLTSSVGTRETALLIDCRSLEITRIPLSLGQFRVVLCDTNVHHRIAGSEYNNRRAECETAVELLKQHLPRIVSLRDVTIDELNRYSDALPDVIKKRCRHVVTENARTLEAARALQVGNLDRLGELLFQSHASLRDDYEVSCRELDLLVEIASELKQVAGARMTGGGFGGCTVNLVEKEGANDFCAAIAQRYSEATGIRPGTYLVKSGDGVGEITGFND